MGSDFPVCDQCLSGTRGDQILQESSRDHGVCKGPPAAQQAGLHRTVFIIELGLYFGLGARLIIAYNAQGETRHHLTVAADSLPVGWDAI